MNVAQDFAGKVSGMPGGQREKGKLEAGSRSDACWLVPVAALILLLSFGYAPAQASALSREEATSIYKEVLRAERVPAGWTGSTATCSVGKESQASLDATLQTVNNLRRMAGAPPVTFNESLNRQALSAALMMAAEWALSHNPGPAWACYSEEGYEGAASSNLYLGISGAEAMVGYVADYGVPSLGHRHWLLRPTTTVMGSGSTGRSNALSVTSNEDPTLVPTGNVVAWPPPGSVPKPWIFEDWSVQIKKPASSSNIRGTPSLEVAVNGKQTRTSGLIENGYFWSYAGYKWTIPRFEDWSLDEGPSGDFLISVSITGLEFREDRQSPWEPLNINYEVDAFDPPKPPKPPKKKIIKPKLRLKVVSRGSRRAVTAVKFPRVLKGRRAKVMITRFRIGCDSTGYCIELGKKRLSSRSVELRPGMRLGVPSPKGRFRTRIKVSTKGWKTSAKIVRSAQVTRTFGR